MACPVPPRKVSASPPFRKVRRKRGPPPRGDTATRARGWSAGGQAGGEQAGTRRELVEGRVEALGVAAWDGQGPPSAHGGQGGEFLGQPRFADRTIISAVVPDLAGAGDAEGGSGTAAGGQKAAATHGEGDRGGTGG